MPTTSNATFAPPKPLRHFLTISEFTAAGGPSRSSCYRLASRGLVNISVDISGRRGVTGAEALRYFTTVRDLAEVKLDLAANRARAARRARA